MRVFITGASGLLGSHVAERLRSEGQDVVALVRQTSDTSFLDSIGVKLREAPLTDVDALAGAIADSDAVVHAAAIVVADATWQTYREVNVGGTMAVLEAAVRAGARRVVHVSSVAVYGGAEVAGLAPVTEDMPLDLPLADGEFYARSKRLAEEAAWRFQREGSLEVSVVRPALMYGERDRVAIPRLLRVLNSPLVPLVGGGQSELPLVHAANVADAIFLALTSERAAGEAFNLATDFPITQRQLFELLARQLGKRPVFVPVPYIAVYGLAAAVESLTRLLSDRPPFLNRRNVSFMGAGNPFDSSRAREVLGWKPRLGHEEGVQRSLRNDR